MNTYELLCNGSVIKTFNLLGDAQIARDVLHEHGYTNVVIKWIPIK